jgi:all-trans-retinol dehydrogenase (NAD+)
MIAQNYGKILSICSVTAFNSLPTAGTYTATKYGLDGFMNALYDELCILEIEDKIKLTTIYPDFIATRRELADIVNNKLFYNMLTPERVADEAVEAIKLGKREKVISDLGFIHSLVKYENY